MICAFACGAARARFARGAASFAYSQQRHTRNLAAGWHAVAARACSRQESASAACLTAGIGAALVASGYSAATSDCGWFASDATKTPSPKLEELYEVGHRVLGEGCFGEVRTARRRSGSTGRGDGFVVKTIDMHRASGDDVAREIAVMQQVEDSGGLSAHHIVH